VTAAPYTLGRDRDPDHTYTLGLDPGRAGMAWGLLRNEDRTLVKARVLPPATKPRDFDRAGPQAAALHAAGLILSEVAGWRITDVVVEYMVHYPPAPARRGARRESERARTAKANDLIDLTAIAALTVGLVCPHACLTYYTAYDWKGYTDTDAIEARLDEWQGWLPGEREIWEDVKKLGKTVRHNAVDVAALLLVHAGRLRLR
jgi:hypothetical protein